MLELCKAARLISTGMEIVLLCSLPEKNMHKVSSPVALI